MSENQEDRLLDHNYDGIQEYDNPMPFWWKALFWLTVVFSVVYLAFYHGGPGLSVEEEYSQAMIAHLDLQASQMGEVTEEALEELATDPAKMTGAQQIFVSRCSQCHGQLGEGNIGPNLTDEYWLHGQGNLLDIYNVVANGVPSKGMLAWKNQLRASELLVVSAYVGTLQGTNPPNAKAPQGVIPEVDETPTEDPGPET